MNRFQKNTDNYFPTLLLIMLAFFLFSFAVIENKRVAISHSSSVCQFIDIHSNTQAVIPASSELPICASFVDENHIILTQSFINDYSISLRIDQEFSSAKEKHLSIKPLFNTVFRRLTYPDPEPNDFIAIS